MPGTFTYTFDTPTFKGTSTLHTGLFINGAWVDPVDPSTIDVVNPACGKIITSVAAGSSSDVDIAVAAAKRAFKTSWGLKCPGVTRGKLLNKLADLLETHTEEFAALEALNVGKPFNFAKSVDVSVSIGTIRYYGGWADKVQGKTIETNEQKFAYSRHEPYGVVAQISPWNFPLLNLAMKIAPAVAVGNTVVLKPSEITPLTALRFADLINEAGFPPGVINIINGYGHTVGQALSEHIDVAKIAITSSTLTGRRVLAASARTNLKDVTLELGGKSPTIIFDDADLAQAVKWTSNGIYLNSGQICAAGSRIFVQETIYNKFLEGFTAAANHFMENTGDPFAATTMYGPVASKEHFDRVMGYIEYGKKEGGKVHFGGESDGTNGFFIKPTLFTDCRPDMKIVREEIFGPVGVVVKFKTEEEVIELANDTSFGLSCNIFTENSSRAIRVAHAIEAGTIWVNCAITGELGVPFGGYKQSGMGRELGEYALDTYTQVKGVHINIGLKL